MCAIVGLDLSVRTYPGGQALRDEGHRQLLRRVRGLLPAGAAWQTEVPLPIPGDQRAWDAMTRLWAMPVAIEAELRPTDLQALERRLALKMRDGRIDRLVLVLADSRANRALVRQAAEALSHRFPLQGRAARKALRGNDDPACNLLLLA